MNDRQVETIEIGKGIKYAKVSSRLAAFHEGNEKCDVDTSCEFKEGYVLFSAKVTTSKGTFSGHSLAKATNEKKAFEKQETIAVGRALAFAGYLSSGDIASQEEMTDYGKSDIVTHEEVSGLKSTWSRVHRDHINGLDKANTRDLFDQWLTQVIGEHDERMLVEDGWQQWTREAMDQCLGALG